MVIRRQLIVGASIGLGVVAVIGLLVLGAQQGIFSGRPQQLLSQASKAQQNGDWAGAQAKLEELLATFPESPWVDDALLKLGEVQESQQRYADARAAYQKLAEQFPDSPLVSQAQTRLGNVNVSLLLSPTVTDFDAAYEIRPGDTLGKIASAYGTTVEFLKKANQLKSDVIQPGRKLKVPKGKFSIVVDKSQNELLLTENNKFIKTYRVSTGKDNSTPIGTFKIVSKLTNPVWYAQGAVVPPNSPENVLGTRWMGFDKKGYGIHGTIEPRSIGQQVTAGCVRMANSDVEELYSIVPMGTDVTIVD